MKTLEEQKVKTLKKIKLIEVEYVKILEYTGTEGLESVLINTSEDEVKKLYKERKNRKLAALIVELYALVEQLLYKVYPLYYDGEEYEKEEGNRRNKIHDLETKLSPFLTFKTNTIMLSNIRNFIVHERFSIKKALKDEKAMSHVPVEIDGENQLFEHLLHTTKEYIIGVEAK